VIFILFAYYFVTVKELGAEGVALSVMIAYGAHVVITGSYLYFRSKSGRLEQVVSGT